MIYTTYLSRLKEIPDGAIKLFIARYAAPAVQESLKKYDCFWYKDFGPSEELHEEYKNGKIPWMLFQAKYIIEQYKNRERNQLWNRYIDSIRETNEINKDIYFICYEKDAEKCHRTPFRNIVTELTGIESKEADFSENNKGC